jgi:hypothetical protein
MGEGESDVLCAPLTGDVANKAADEFYKEFNLISKSDISILCADR